MTEYFYFVTRNRYLIYVSSEFPNYYCLAKENVNKDTAAYEVEKFTVISIYDLLDKDYTNNIGDFVINKEFDIQHNHSEYNNFCVAYKSQKVALSRLPLQSYASYFPSNDVNIFHSYFQNGQISEEYEYINGKRNGKYTLYFCDGTIHMTRYFKDNVELKSDY
jgi:hypothetical protein